MEYGAFSVCPAPVLGFGVSVSPVVPVGVPPVGGCGVGA
jgi:hypothetical protein